jgi:hypothetical protein
MPGMTTNGGNRRSFLKEEIIIQLVLEIRKQLPATGTVN